MLPVHEFVVAVVNSVLSGLILAALLHVMNRTKKKKGAAFTTAGSASVFNATLVLRNEGKAPLSVRQFSFYM
jgi:hypothetical protein